MNPRLTILNGSLESRIFLFNDAEVITIGRAVRNQVSIPDSIMSREHALIRKTVEGYRIEDLDSQNGVFVNNVSVSKILLKHGDRIRIGETYLLFLILENNESENFSNVIHFDDDLAETKLDLNANYEKFDGKLSPEFDALTRIGESLNEIQNSEQLQKKLLSIILEIIPAERGAVILLNEDLVSPHSVCVLSKAGIGGEQMNLSRSITEKVLNEKVSVMINDLRGEGFLPSESLISTGVNSLLCVPLLSGEISGLIYLDSRDAAFRFENTHLQQMTALGSLIVSALKNVNYLESLKSEKESLQNLFDIETDMIGESEPMKKMSQMIAKVSPLEATILITGESGTGKELVARAIHKNSLRKSKPFVAVNCAVLTETFLDSDLFGHERGSFTGATERRKGKIEIAHGGTLFLDEIGELALSLQAKLLRVLQEKEFERIGGDGKPIESNIRLLAATNRDLKEEVRKGNFREDLFFRLNVVQIHVPPLRERKSDILLLAHHFTKKHSELCKRKINGISHSAKHSLIGHQWRGNVRELENVIERAVILGSDNIIQMEDLPFDISETTHEISDSNLNLNQQLKIAKRKIILDALTDAGGNYSEAARRLSIHPNNLHRIIRDLEIKDKAKNVRPEDSDLDILI